MLLLILILLAASILFAVLTYGLGLDGSSSAGSGAVQTELEPTLSPICRYHVPEHQPPEQPVSLPQVNPSSAS
jgi:hypothetical protein